LIESCFVHCPGIGPKTDSILREKGFETWEDCLEHADDLPIGASRKEAFIAEINKSRERALSGDIAYFIKLFPSKEHWRILSEYLDRATFFDIETTSLSWYAGHTSAIVALHRGELHTFVYGENIDDFLDLLDDASYIVSFNGKCFDVPFLEHSFNISSIDVPHIDLRWVAYYAGYNKGLKTIEEEMGIRRPLSLQGIDGMMAVDLYYRWQSGDISARDLLVRYCTADVIGTYLATERILRKYSAIKSITDSDVLFSKYLGKV
jgi:hypothetical protein